jgi:hypothetical protein
MVGVCTGSFRGVRDQPVTGHEGPILRPCVTFGRIRRVFGACSARPSCSLVLAGLLIAAGHVDLSRWGAPRGALGGPVFSG